MYKLTKIIFKIAAVFSILFFIYGILKVNNTLPEIVKGYSSFSVEEAQNPNAVSIKAGEYKITFSAKNFESFFKGVDAISDTFKQAFVR